MIWLTIAISVLNVFLMLTCFFFYRRQKPITEGMVRAYVETEMALRKVASNESLMKLIALYPSKQFSDALLILIEKEGLTWHQRELIEAVLEQLREPEAAA